MSKQGSSIAIQFAMIAFSYSLAACAFAQGSKAATEPVASQRSASAAAVALQLENFTVLALGPTDGRVVLQFPDKKMNTLQAGDVIAGTRAAITKVLADKLVLEETSPDGKSKQLVWMFKGNAGSSRVQRFNPTFTPTAEQQPPKSITVLDSGGNGNGPTLKRKQP